MGIVRNLIALLYLVFPLVVSNKVIPSWHCPLACTTCPASDINEPFCMVSPFRIEFPCLCLLRSFLCLGFAQTAVFYEGACHKNAYSYLDNPALPLLTFRGEEKVYLRGGVTEVQKRFAGVEEDAVTKWARQKHDRLCQLFFQQDPVFMRYYESKHFKCSTVDVRKTNPLPPLE